MILVLETYCKQLPQEEKTKMQIENKAQDTASYYNIISPVYNENHVKGDSLEIQNFINMVFPVIMWDNLITSNLLQRILFMTSERVFDMTDQRSNLIG